ncbi:kinase-like domain-containing protein [Rhizophagus clarus]|uniref:Kinase-like domain-containing protein n=1 Tax=Rhizophagus clarus TaxID=94130 RepID=A0A8H3LFH3_9GLOM|nr:kinase-like domain-containing protein [Rhizophagus clarus]
MKTSGIIGNGSRHTKNYDLLVLRSRNWTSDYDGIDKFIQNTRPPAINQFEVLEWIPYDEFCDIEYIAKGDFETLYRAKDMYDVEIMKIRNWDRFDSNEFVVLKSLNNSENVAYEFINENITINLLSKQFVLLEFMK